MEGKGKTFFCLLLFLALSQLIRPALGNSGWNGNRFSSKQPIGPTAAHSSSSTTDVFSSVYTRGFASRGRTVRGHWLDQELRKRAETESEPPRQESIVWRVAGPSGKQGVQKEEETSCGWGEFCFTSVDLTVPAERLGGNASWLWQMWVGASEEAQRCGCMWHLLGGEN